MTSKTLPRSLYWTFIAEFILSLLVTAYWWIRFDGLYRILAQWELRVFGSYGVSSTGFFTLLFLCGALMIATVLWWRFMGWEMMAARGAVLKPATPPPSGLQNSGNGTSRTFFDFLSWLKDRRLALVLAVFTVVGLGYGSYQVARSIWVGPLTEMPLADLYEGREPPSRFIRTEGRLELEKSVGVKESTKETYYIPLVPASWSDGDEIRVVVEVEERYKFEKMNLRMNQGPLEGVLSAGLAGFPLQLFKDDGTWIFDKPWVLEEGKSSDLLRSQGIFFLVIGLLCGGILALYVFKKYRRP